MELVRSKAKQIAENNKIDTIIIDGPPNWLSVISSITGADKVIVVTEPTLSGLHDLKRTLEIVANFGIETQGIINKYDLNEAMTENIEVFCAKQQVNIAGKIAFDPRAIEAMIHKQSIVEYAPESEAARVINEVLRN